MGKIVIVGATHSGKSCYFYGMMRKLMTGIHGFSICTEPKDYGDIRRAIKRLNDVSLPLEQRFPAPNSERRTYKLKLQYNLAVLEEFDWEDYPGEFVETKVDEFIRLLDGADSLLLCVDGEGIQGDPEDLDNLADDLIDFWNCMDLNNALAQAAVATEVFPPVCIMITKYDKVDPAFRQGEILTELMKKIFPILFRKKDINGKNRLVTICPVTLGKDLDQGGRLAPKNVEKPICFATYLIQLAKVRQMEKQAQDYISAHKAKIEEYNKQNPFKKLITQKPEPLTQEQIAAVQELINGAAEDLDAIRATIEQLPLYLNGEPIKWN